MSQENVCVCFCSPQTGSEYHACNHGCLPPQPGRTMLTDICQHHPPLRAMLPYSMSIASKQRMDLWRVSHPALNTPRPRPWKVCTEMAPRKSPFRPAVPHERWRQQPRGYTSLQSGNVSTTMVTCLTCRRKRSLHLTKVVFCVVCLFLYMPRW